MGLVQYLGTIGPNLKSMYHLYPCNDLLTVFIYPSSLNVDQKIATLWVSYANPQESINGELT